MTGDPPGEKSTASGPRIALALGGGSARGLAHIVMLEVFDELGIKPAIIAGTSMGSICGACYAAGLSAAEIREGFESQFTSAATFFKQFAGKLRGGISTLWSVRSPGIVDNVTLFEMLLPEVLHSDFESLKIPFLAIAADFYAIEQVILDHGPVIPALAASCALPGMARPVVLEGRVLIDGGYINPVPYDVVMDRADITVAVDVTGDPQRRPGARVPGTVEAVTGATQLLFHSITREKLKSIAPDIFIRPKVGAYSALDYFKIGEILDAAQDAKDDLKRQLSQRLEAIS
jgi:NTE family protein